jgi:hypothetical protein
MAGKGMTYRAKGWLCAIAVSLTAWTLIALVAHEAVMLWDRPVSEKFDDRDA